VKVALTKYIALCNDEHTRLFQCLLISKHVKDATDRTTCGDCDTAHPVPVEDHATSLVVRLIEECISPTLTGFLQATSSSFPSSSSSSSSSVAYYREPIVHVSVGSVPLHSLSAAQRDIVVAGMNRHILPIEEGLVGDGSDNSSDNSSDDSSDSNSDDSSDQEHSMYSGWKGATLRGVGVSSESVALDLSCIECKIGNRLFRVQLSKLQSGFVEIFA
jgi:hypothetical protein